jgi:hypothetical protein
MVLEPAFVLSAMVSMGVIRDLTSRKHREHRQSSSGQTQAKGLLKRPSAKRAEELLSLSQNQLRVLTWLLTEHCHLNRHLFKLGLVENSGCGRCKQAFEKPCMFFVTVSH